MADVYTQLTSGVPITTTATAGDILLYRVDKPASSAPTDMAALTVVADGVDVELYVKYGAPFADGANPAADADSDTDNAGAGIELTGRLIPVQDVYVAVKFWDAGSVQLSAALNAWSGAFDAGPKIVFVQTALPDGHGGGEYLPFVEGHRGAMGKGDSAVIQGGYLAGYTVAIANDGAITLTGDAIGSAGALIRVGVVAPDPAVEMMVGDLNVFLGNYDGDTVVRGSLDVGSVETNAGNRPTDLIVSVPAPALGVLPDSWIVTAESSPS